MKRLFIIAALLLAAVPTKGAAAFVHSHSCPFGDGTLKTSYKCPLPFTSLAGNLALVYVTTNTPATTLTVTDSASQTYTQGVSAGVNNVAAIYFFPNTAAGVNSITVASSPGIGFIMVVYAEFSGIATAAPGDGTCNGNGTATAMACGTAITTTVAGDLVVHVGLQDSGIAETSVTAGAGGWALYHADLLANQSGNTPFAQWIVQGTAGAITPTATLSASAHFDVVAMAFKAAAAGTAPSGMYIDHSYTLTYNNTQTSPINSQFPCTGNTLVMMPILGQALTLSGVTTTPANTWTLTADFNPANGAGDLRPAYVIGATCSTAMTISITFTGVNVAGDVVKLFSITGGGAFDATAGAPSASGTDATAAAHSFNTVSITPSTADGIIFYETGVNNAGPADAGTPGLFIAATGVPESTQSDMDSNNAWQVEYNTTTTARTNTVHFPATAGGAGGWGARAIHISAPGGGGGGGTGLGNLLLKGVSP